ncbi:hypothetical protein HMPREF9265_0620 [Limosilactobacillus oris PB013-T2-3]|uniref:Uncharacterized protein n=1 Tax=Limosilactobacillus oris PB013-T2-3 TaxID=908339 RepID=E3C8R9_9LACO|nr:hypothetical protein HMPREF9265_0620 [Limosilactobacillus oris PB013-T2-3]
MHDGMGEKAVKGHGDYSFFVLFEQVKCGYYYNVFRKKDTS